MSTINSVNYPPPPSSNGGDDGLRPSVAGVVRSLGRGQVATPQALIVLQATARKDEIQLRKRQANGCADKDLFAPPVDNPSAFNIKKGMLGLCRLLPGTTFRGALQADQGANVEVVCNMAGLHRKSRLGMPCVVQVNREADKPGSDDRTTIVPDGVQTIVNTGMEHVEVGDKLLADPNSPVVEVNGQFKPATDILGLVDGQMYHIGIRVLKSNTLHSMVRLWKERLRCLLGDDNAIKTKLAAVEGPDGLGRVLKDAVDNVVLDDRLAQDMPIKGYLHVWLPFFLMKLTALQSQTTTVPAVARSTFLVWCMQLLRVRLCDCMHSFSAIAEEYEASLPHNLRTRRALVPDKMDYTVLSAKLEESLSDTHINDAFDANPVTATYELMELQARLDLFTTDTLDILMSELQSWLSRLTIGTALSSAAKGKPLDVLFGRNH